MTTQATADDVAKQWKHICRNVGVWPGYVTTHSRSGAETQRTSSLLLVYAETEEDAARLRAHQPPQRLAFTLRSGGPDRTLPFVATADMRREGRVFDAAGSMCSGPARLGGLWNVVEQNVNSFAKGYPHDGNRQPDQFIAARARTVLFFDAQGALARLTVYREVAADTTDVFRAGLTADMQADGPLPARWACTFDREGRASLAGAWRGTRRVLRGLAAARVDGAPLEEEVGYTRVETEGTLRDGAARGGEEVWTGAAEGTVEAGERVVRWRTADGRVEERVWVEGGVYVRWTMVLGAGGVFAAEIGWAVGDAEVLRIRREYEQGDWVSSSFCYEVRDATT